MKKTGAVSLLFTGLGSIIGSGWLFGAANAARIAGPLAPWAWVIGAGMILCIAASYAELGAMFPESGGMVRYVHYSHGPMLGLIAAWANWISIVSVIPIEAEASVQYMSSWPWHWAGMIYRQGHLDTLGMLLTALLVVIYFLLNFWGIKLFIRANNLLTVFKVIVPTLTSIIIISSGFHTQNLHTSGGTAHHLPGILMAVATSGIVFSFNGFQSPINLAGEADHPGRNVPLAVMGSIIISAILYLLLQFAFIGALTPADLRHGWHGINFSSPFAQLALAVGVNWLVLLLYLDAFVSPSGTGTNYMASVTRMLTGVQRNGMLPAFFGKIHPVWQFSRHSLIFNLIICFIFMYFFRGWNSLAAVISVATVVTYLTGPVSAAALRLNHPEIHRPLKVMCFSVVAPFSFVFASLVLYWGSWPLTGEIIILMSVSLPLYFYYRLKTVSVMGLVADCRNTIWFIGHLGVIALISWCGDRNFGGQGLIPTGWDMPLVIVFSMLFFYMGKYSGIKDGHPGVQKNHFPDEFLRDPQKIQ